MQVEGIFAQLIFEHSLRIRMKAETDSESRGATQLPVLPTPQTTSVEESSTQDNHIFANPSLNDSPSSTAIDVSQSQDNTRQGSSASSDSPKGKTKAPIESGEKREEGKQSNLVGKITNLITTDLDNITGGDDFLYIVLYMPLQIGLCIYFLYQVLGWR